MGWVENTPIDVGTEMERNERVIMLLVVMVVTCGHPLDFNLKGNLIEHVKSGKKNMTNISCENNSADKRNGCELALQNVRIFTKLCAGTNQCKRFINRALLNNINEECKIRIINKCNKQK